jgi:ethanolaminephosphotransferase
MVLGGFGLAFNIISRWDTDIRIFRSLRLTMNAFFFTISYRNVRRSTLASGRSGFRPVLLLLPFSVATAIQVIWLNSSTIINSPLFVPFLCSWGLQFAHQVGRMILAHVCHTPFPWFDTIWLWGIAGAIDANLPRILGR